MEYPIRLPPDQVHLLEDDDVLSDAERARINELRARLQAGDERDFEDWEDVRERF